MLWGILIYLITNLLRFKTESHLILVIYICYINNILIKIQFNDISNGHTFGKQEAAQHIGVIHS